MITCILPFLFKDIITTAFNTCNLTEYQKKLIVLLCNESYKIKIDMCIVKISTFAMYLCFYWFKCYIYLHADSTSHQILSVLCYVKF